jgi:hypothetical protein
VIHTAALNRHMNRISIMRQSIISSQTFIGFNHMPFKLIAEMTIAAATGHAAASPNGQIVLPSIFLCISHKRSMSFISPLPLSIFFNIFSIQPVPSRQGLNTVRNFHDDKILPMYSMFNYALVFIQHNKATTDPSYFLLQNRHRSNFHNSLNAFRLWLWSIIN